MSAIRESSVLEALKVVTDPDLGRDIVSLGFIKNLAIDDGRVSFTIELTTPACPVKDQMRDQAQAAVSQGGWGDQCRRGDDGQRPVGGGTGQRSRPDPRRQEHHRRGRGQGRRG